MSARRGILWDSSAILALLDANDADHERAVAAAGQIASERRPSLITNYIEVQAHALLLSKLERILTRECYSLAGCRWSVLLRRRIAPGRSSRGTPIKTGVFVTQFPLRFWRFGESAAHSHSTGISFSTAVSRSSVYRADIEN